MAALPAPCPASSALQLVPSAAQRAPLERNYTFRQLREEGILPLSDRTLKRIFQDEPGVIPIPCPGGKKKNRKWLVPRHVVERVLTRHATT
jgi:hypothetical protein